MAALSFKASFVDLILDGSKTQTIRNYRKNPLRVGETLYLYYAQRTPESKKLKEVVCKAIYHVIINEDCIFIHYRHKNPFIPAGKIAKVLKTQKELDEFACADGFFNWATYAPVVEGHTRR